VEKDWKGSLLFRVQKCAEYFLKKENEEEKGRDNLECILPYSQTSTLHV
jgi:hypothetical protein